VVREVCQAIIDEYVDEVLVCPSIPDGWRVIADKFFQRIVERQPFYRLRHVIVGDTLPRIMRTLDYRWAYVVNVGNTLSIRWYKLSISYRNVLCKLLIRYVYAELVMNTLLYAKN